MRKNIREQTTYNHHEAKESKLVRAETSSDQVKPEAQQDQQKLQLSAAVLKRLMEVYGTDDEDFLKGILKQILKCSPSRDQEEIDFMISVIKQEKPRKHVDMMLVTQMVATHKAIMRCANELAGTSDLRLLDTVGRVVDRLMRTYVLQRDLLMRCQAGGAAPTVAVQNVLFNEGAQAIVGNVMQNQTPRENTPDKPAVASPPAMSHAKTAPMSMMEDSKERVAVPGKILRYRTK
jgi:hypothetical protein